MQDDFHVSKKLTLNLGFRWDFETGPTERFDRYTAMDPFAVNPVSRRAGREVRGGYLFSGGTLGRRAIRGTDMRMWNPRVGFAYQASERLVVRAAYGIFFGPPAYGPTNYFVGAPFSSQTAWLATLDGVTPNHRLSNPYPDGFSLPEGPRAGLEASLGLDLATAWPESLKPMYNQQWNFTIQRSLGGDTGVEIAYAGNKGTKLPMVNQLQYTAPNMNQLHPGQLGAGNELLQLVRNPFFGVIQNGVLSQAMVQLGQLARPYPHFANVLPYVAGWGNSNFHSLQMRLEKRFSGGLSTMMSYTWSKTITDGNDGYWNGTWRGQRDWYCRACDRSISTYDQPHRFVANFNYELPLGRGKMLGGGWSRWMDGVFGQWQVNGILMFSSGLPLTMAVANNTSFSFGGNQRPDAAGTNANLGAGRRIERWFDTGAFTAPRAFTFGNLGRTHGSLRSDGASNLDFSVFKRIAVKERLTFELRGEAFNLANHVLFGAPGTTLATPTFGVVTGQENSPRQVQVALKVLF
jgi:hypothetical protein